MNDNLDILTSHLRMKQAQLRTEIVSSLIAEVRALAKEYKTSFVLECHVSPEGETLPVIQQLEGVRIPALRAAELTRIAKAGDEFGVEARPRVRIEANPGGVMCAVEEIRACAA